MIIDLNNAMHMIGHDDKCSQRDIIPYRGGLRPFLMCDCAKVIQDHFSIADLPEQRQPILHAQGQEIQAFLPIIVSCQSDAVLAAICVAAMHVLFAI